MKQVASHCLILLLLPFYGMSQHTPKSVNACLKPFYHGVASGDPLSDRVILWTRITPENGSNLPQIVEWKIAKDTLFTLGLQSGVVLTDQTKDYTVKVDPTGLEPNTTYYYQFKSDTLKSVIGRTRTAPVGDCDSLRFAVVSCANFEAGYFNVFSALKERNDFDAVICLGDYIYEYESGGYSPNPTVNRQWEPSNEILSLSDYRARYSTYRLDDDLRDLHQQFPMIVVWDDHETANDAWMNGAENHQVNEGSFAARKASAKQAFFEWLPIRVTGTTDPYQIFREIKYGDLADLIMLDTRLHGRDQQAGTSGSTVTSTTRQLLGTDQFSWLGTRLSQSTEQWKVLAQQVMIAPLTLFGAALNGDQWDGYPAERNRVINHILTYDIKDVVVITGDIHSSWANDIPASGYNGSTGSGSAGVEFVAPSVTSPGMNIPGGASALMLANSHIKFAELSAHGFVILDINKARTQADWYYVNTIDSRNSGFSYAASFKTTHLSRNLTAVNAASIPRNGIQGFQLPTCPYYPYVPPSTAGLNEDAPVILSLFPNPASENLFLNLSLPFQEISEIYLVDHAGKKISLKEQWKAQAGSSQWMFDIHELPAGMYSLYIQNGTSYVLSKVIKE
ncbi:alkaline phosphatase D family protein [Fluviicola chungangensis]|uniref:T9SS type A sorting domain-containing protein n=1 Tax=Fluviicola chungangensis TaxID=2597671 RepID=A0A556N409_9FLAO|nr:alkaline phosphatase D family protein [Fluviicola chungangensis]TSJ46773.1 T9SS type A sorting domain-containing protein [Fluviicola chungangensis]